MITLTLLENVEHGVPSGNYDGSSLDFASDAANGPGYYQGYEGSQTVNLRLVNFQGTIEIQGTLNQILPTAEVGWVKLTESVVSEPTTLNQTLTVEGQYNWVRVRVVDFENGVIDLVTSSYQIAVPEINWSVN